MPYRRCRIGPAVSHTCRIVDMIHLIGLGEVSDSEMAGRWHGGRNDAFDYIITAGSIPSREYQQYPL